MSIAEYTQSVSINVFMIYSAVSLKMTDFQKDINLKNAKNIISTFNEFLKDLLIFIQ